MTVAVTFRNRAAAALRRRRGSAPRRRAWAASAVTLLLACSVMIGGAAPVRADQNVYFDEAGSSAPRISLIGDSTLTGVRWYGRYGALRQFNFVLNAESCRRTVEPSCVSREGYRSRNVVATMYDLRGELGEVLVIMSGYNDPRWSIPRAIDNVVDEARNQGVEHVIWLTLRASPDVDYSDPQEQSSINSFRVFNERLLEVAEETDGYLQVADWATYTLGASGWFERDGVHLTRSGVDAVTSFIADRVHRVVNGHDITPTAAPWTILVPGAEGEVVEAVQQALLDHGIDVPGGADGEYGNDTMIAVANYQRLHGNLQVTGAVDIRTARSLGVYEDPDDADDIDDTGGDDSGVPTDSAPADSAGGEPASSEAAGAATATEPADTTAQVAVSPLATESSEPGAGDGGMPRWPIYSGSAAVALAAAVVGRRRYVLAQRNGRHAAGVAGAGHAFVPSGEARFDEAGFDGSATPTIYDHELEDER